MGRYGIIMKNLKITDQSECICGNLLRVKSRDGLTQRLVRFKIGTKEEYDSIPVKDGNILYFCQDTGNLFVGDVNYNSVADIDSLKEILATDIEESTASDDFIPTVKAVVDFTNSKLSSITGGLMYAGVIDASDPTKNPMWTDAKQGYFFRVNVAGVIDGVTLGVGDTIIINKKVTGQPTKGDMDVIPFTLDEIGDLNDLKTQNKENLVSAINEVAQNECRWIGL